MDYDSQIEDLTFDTLDIEDIALSAHALKSNNPYRISENEFLFLEADRLNNRLLFKYSDKHMKVSEEYFTDSIGISVDGAYLFQVSKDHEKFLIVNIIKPVFEPGHLEILIFDRFANILKKVKMPLGYANSSFEIMDWDEKNHTMKILATKFNFEDNDPKSVRTSLDVLYVNSNDEVTIEKKIFASDSLRYIGQIVCEEYLEDKYLIKFEETSIYFDELDKLKIDYRAKAISYMMVDKSYFDIEVNTEETHRKDFILYPNPSNGQFTIELSGCPSNSKIMISNLRGELVHYDIISYSDFYTTDLVDLLPGIYTFIVSFDGSILCSGKWIKE